ncbi:MAG: PDDEXK family nuclease [Acidimicrobiales bacterium]
MSTRRPTRSDDTPSFAHESERHFADLLDFYGVRWKYEPVEFVLEWHEDGSPRSAFRPDFYLPDHGTFVELTTLSQKLVTRKHAKLRRLRALHPGVEVKLLYLRDYEAMAAKYRFARATTPAA